MAEQRRFHFDSDTRSVDVPAGRRRVSWLWIAISLAIHGAIVLFVLAGAARGGHTELLGTLDVTLVGAPSAGDPDSKSSETKEATPDAAARPDTPPMPPQAEPLPQPAAAKPAEAAPPPTPKAANVPPPPTEAPPPKHAAVPPPANAATPPSHPQPPPPQQQAALPEAPTSPPSPEGIAKPAAPAVPADPKATPVEVTPPPLKPAQPETAAAPVPPKAPAPTAEPKVPAAPSAEAAVPAKPVLPETKTALATPARPKVAPDAKATPTAKAAPATKPTEKPAAEKAATKQGVKRAVEGQTASLGAPTGGDRLGRSDNDDTNGVLNVNLNPRFRQPPPPPHYPRQSVERDEEGVVLVRAFVDPAGAPQRVVVFRTSGFPLLDEAALKAVQGWRFEPMVREGRATAAWVQVPVRFRLN